MHVSGLTCGGMLAAALLFAANAHANVITEPVSSGIGPLAGGNTYAEAGDAGDAFSPQNVVGGDIGRITGEIGPLFVGNTALPSDIDTLDAFRFYFSGGAIEFIGVLHLPGDDPCAGFCAAVPFDIGLPLSLFRSSNPGTPLVPDPGFPPNDIGFGNLAAGNYIIQAAFDAFDPPFEITIFTVGAVGAPIPEPATLALLGLGLAGLGYSRRKRIEVH